MLKCNSLAELLNQATLSRPCLPVCLVPCLVPAQLVAREDQGMPCGTPIPQHTFQEQKETIRVTKTKLESIYIILRTNENKT